VPPRRSLERHAEVLDAASELVRQKGLDATSLQDVADAVGIKKGSLATYFSSKAELVGLIQERFTEVAEEQLTLIAERSDLPPDKRLRELLYFHAEHCTLNLSSPVLVGFMQLWTASAARDGTVQPDIVRQYQRTFEDVVAECSRKRIFRKSDPALVVNGLMGIMSWCAFWYSDAEHGPLRPLVDKLIDMCFDGLRPRPRAGR
jgi:TetR/AcrR family transcriptional regulator, cholesterol catabolism regulator